MDYAEDSAVLTYIKHVLEELRISPTALALKAGISPTTLTRPLNSRGYKFKLSTTTLDKIAHVSGISYAAFLHQGDFPSLSLATTHEKGQYNEEIWGKQPETDLNSTIVVGDAAAGMWQEVGVHDLIDRGMLLIQSSNYKPSDCFALHLLDSHAGSFAYLGDYLFCVRYEACVDRIVSGCTVILERRQEDRRLVEFTARRIQRVKAGWQLTTIDNRERIRQQTTLAELPGTELDRVVGLVLYVVRDVPQA